MKRAMSEGLEKEKCEGTGIPKNIYKTRNYVLKSRRRQGICSLRPIGSVTYLKIRCMKYLMYLREDA